jgi:V8-like Glu-specific endopeptidase
MTPSFGWLRNTMFVCAAVLVSTTAGRAQTSPTPLGNSPEETATITQTTSPYYFVGRITATFGPYDYIATGTVIKTKSVITCAHILWDKQYGWGTNVYFERALAGSSALNTNYASSKLILSGYGTNVRAHGVDSNQAFARDFGALRFGGKPAQGGHVGYWCNVGLLNGQYTTMSLGYGAETHTGDELLKSAPTAAYYKVYGGYWNNDSFLIEGGMSGGPIFAKSGSYWYECGLNLSGDNTGMGIHAFNAAAQQFISTYLR